MFSKNTFFLFLKTKNNFIVVKCIFLFFVIENKKLFLKRVTKQALTPHS